MTSFKQLKQNNSTTTATVVQSFGRMFVVKKNSNGNNSDNNITLYEAVTKAKKTDYVVGDVVKINVINDNQAQIVDLIPRHNLIFRSDHNRSKIIASNVSQLLIVIAVKPTFNINFLNSCLICAESESINPVIIINKSDIPESQIFINKIESLYNRQLNYPIITLSAIDNCESLKILLKNQQSLLIGQSGVGKSTITNQIIPDAKTTTYQITKSEASGSHTTTNATLYYIDDNSSIVDCPGLHEFGLNHLKIPNLLNFFPEFRDYIGKCRFRDCKHLNEPNCFVLNAISDPTRLKFLQQLTQKLLNNKNKY